MLFPRPTPIRHARAFFRALVHPLYPVGAICVLLLVGGCRPRATREVVAYVALDREFSEPVLRDFERETGIHVVAKYDLESTKTVGLANEILNEPRRPRCDLFWNNEILHTLRLERAGLLDAVDSPAGSAFPPDVKSADGDWYGFAARARVLIVNTQRVADDERPRRVADLADPRWKDQAGIAKPLFGTTATHAAVLFARDERAVAEAFFRQVNANARILSGNKQVAVAVGRGQLAWGLTDTDDAWYAVRQGWPVAVVFPDQGPEDAGTLFIPNTLGVIRGGPHAAHARKLLEYLLRAEVEERLARGESGQFPLNPAVATRPELAPTDPPRPMAVDFARAAAGWDEAARWLRREFEGP